MFMPTLEETQAQLNYEVAIYREQITMIKRETERISLTIVDLTNALRTAENLATKKVLVPIGGGAMVRGGITETTVLVPVGAQYMVEMNKDDATSELKRRIEATKKAVGDETNPYWIGRKISERVEENIREDYI